MSSRLPMLWLGALLACWSTLAAPVGGTWHAISGANIYWINDVEVLFVGFKAEDAKLIADGQTNPYRVDRSLMAWNSTNDTARVIATKLTGFLCYNKGIVHYNKREEKGEIYYAGPLGGEKPQGLPTGWTDFVRCNTGARSSTALDHGVLELPERESTDKQLSLRTTDGSLIPLHGYGYKDMRTSLVTTGIRFYPFKGAYLLAEQGFNGKSSTVWWLYPNGRTERIPMPVGPRDRHGRLKSSFGAARPGILVHHPVPMDWSLYLVQSGRIRKLLSGAVMRYSTSPDGCKVAYLHMPIRPAEESKLTRFPTLRVKAVCLRN